MTKAKTLAELALAECKLRGSITVCKNIALATHDHDGDMARLKDAFVVCERLGADADLVAEGDALFKKLETEVALFDVVNDVKAAWANVEKVVEDCRIFTESPEFSLLPRPEPIPGPDGEMVAPPTKQMVALDALRDQLAVLDELAVRACWRVCWCVCVCVSVCLCFCMLCLYVVACAFASVWAPVWAPSCRRVRGGGLHSSRVTCCTRTTRHPRAPASSLQRMHARRIPPCWIRGVRRWRQRKSVQRWRKQLASSWRRSSRRKTRRRRRRSRHQRAQYE